MVRAGLVASPQQGTGDTLHGPTETRGLQGPREPSGSGLSCGALAESLVSGHPGGKRSPGRCWLQGQGTPSRNLLLSCPGLSTLWETVGDTAHDQPSQQERQQPSPPVQGKIFLPSHFLCRNPPTIAFTGFLDPARLQPAILGCGNKAALMLYVTCK